MSRDETSMERHYEGVALYYLSTLLYRFIDHCVRAIPAQQSRHSIHTMIRSCYYTYMMSSRNSRYLTTSTPLAVRSVCNIPFVPSGSCL
jgi:hypothetical protein